MIRKFYIDSIEVKHIKHIGETSIITLFNNQIIEISLRDWECHGTTDSKLNLHNTYYYRASFLDVDDRFTDPENKYPIHTYVDLVTGLCIDITLFPENKRTWSYAWKYLGNKTPRPYSGPSSKEYKFDPDALSDCSACKKYNDSIITGYCCYLEPIKDTNPVVYFKPEYSIKALMNL